jgi:signal transduction histidine kinase
MLVDTAQQVDLLEASFEALVDGVVVFDRYGRILLANEADCALFGFGSRFSRVALSLREHERRLGFRQRRRAAAEQSPFARILSGETLSARRSVSATLRAPNGREVRVSVCGAPIYDEDGHIAGGVAVTQEVAEVGHEVQVLGDTVCRLEETLAIAAHELRTPISASKGYVQLAKKRLASLMQAAVESGPAVLDEAEQLRAHLNAAERSMTRLGGLVDRLLDVARIQANKFEVRPEVVNLAALVRAAVREHQLANPSRLIRGLTPPTLAVPILADPTRIGQVLANYLANALKYSPDEATVEVSLRLGRDEARVSVKDEGQGIAPDQHERVWSRFEQIEGTVTRASDSGLGIGLYISRAIVEAHGGRVGLESAVGRGSTFSFVLPLTRATA